MGDVDVAYPCLLREYGYAVERHSLSDDPGGAFGNRESL